MNLEHLRAFLWLRWRLRYNQFRKAGAVNAVFYAIYMVLALVASVGLFVTGLLVGLLAMPHAPPVVRLYVWDGVVIVFLFFWMIGLMIELQRAEGLALDKILHLPVSPAGGFLVNYLSSLSSLTLVAFVPGMVGLILGQSISISPTTLLGLPLLAAFILAITAVTYQFQGWLASLMTDKRRRRTVIFVVTFGFILLMQVPQLIHVVRPWEDAVESHKRLAEKRSELTQDFAAQKMTHEEFKQRDKEIQEKHHAERAESDRQKLAELERITRMVNLVVPIGWFPLGAASLPDNDILPALLAFLGFVLIGMFSLRRAYRTTVRLYTGHFTSGSARRKSPTDKPKLPVDPRKVPLIERRIPWVSEHASAVGTAAFRSLLRAPESKMMLIAPLIMVVVFGGVVLRAGSPPDVVRPLIAVGAGAMIVLMSVQLVGNQFGYDRTGFRAYVLSPAPRREILLGKNLAVAPLVLGFGLFAVLVVGIGYPMRFDHYPAALAQVLTMYLLFCLLANALSIIAPIPMAAGSMQPSQVKMVPVLLQMCFMFVFPVMLVPVLLPLGVEILVEEATEVRGWPIALVLSLAVLAIVVFLYRRMLTVEGEWLEMREQKILEVVTSKTE